MKNYIVHHPWKVIEAAFHPQYNEITESLMSLGNGRIGQRGNFEETYSGSTLQGNYVAGVYYPDKTRVGWWKNGYPDYFAKVLNSCNWIGIKISIGQEVLNLATCRIEHFERVLDMQQGVLYRKFTVSMPSSGIVVEVNARRFCSLTHDAAGAISYQLRLVEAPEEQQVTIEPFLDGTISNKDANYDETFWQEIEKETSFAAGSLLLETKPNAFQVEQFQVATSMLFDVRIDGLKIPFESLPIKKEKYVAGKVQLSIRPGQVVDLYKYAATLSSMDHKRSLLLTKAKEYVLSFASAGFDQRLTEHQHAWLEKWKISDIEIEGDVAAQQGIRFNIFHLSQTYTGTDARLNIGPKGFTGEKYGGSTYWDTEAYCLPFYLATAPQSVARNLLLYRYKHLPKAIENAQKLGFTEGAALYPMVTMNGEECHNEWEITFEEIHRNGAIAYAIYDYVRYTNDEDYLVEYGLEVLVALARFWKQRVNWSTNLQQYVLLGVTGPNEYENNVNNNWYTNYIARWTLRYTAEQLARYRYHSPVEALLERIAFSWQEAAIWQEIAQQLYLPFDEERQVFLQQQGFLDKELLTVDQIQEHRPINQNWSWDRILRSCFIKQADVLQGLYFFEDDFTKEEIERNFAFYEPMTVHESSLSPCVHAILAASIGREEKAYEMYLRTARLDLDDYNNDTEDGLHITSMAGTWMSIVKGFAGQRVSEDELVLSPIIPSGWRYYKFHLSFRGSLLEIVINSSEVIISNLSNAPANVRVYGIRKMVYSGEHICISRP